MLESCNPLRADHAIASCETMAPAPRWFAISTVPRHEKHVSEILGERRIENFLPLYRAVRQWKKRCPVVLELPLFPRYLFVRIAARARGCVLGVPGVLSIVGPRQEPWPLSDFEVDAMRTGLHLRKAEPHPYLVVGQRARIKAGPLVGMEGVLLRKKNIFRLVLTLDVIMQSVAVEVDACDVEPLANR